MSNSALVSVFLRYQATGRAGGIGTTARSGRRCVLHERGLAIDIRVVPVWRQVVFNKKRKWPITHHTYVR